MIVPIIVSAVIATPAPVRHLSRGVVPEVAIIAVIIVTSAVVGPVAVMSVIIPGIFARLGDKGP
jgi:hypothetical protein